MRNKACLFFIMREKRSIRERFATMLGSSGHVAALATPVEGLLLTAISVISKGQRSLIEMKPNKYIDELCCKMGKGFVKTLRARASVHRERLSFHSLQNVTTLLAVQRSCSAGNSTFHGPAVCEKRSSHRLVDGEEATVSATLGSFNKSV